MTHEFEPTEFHAVFCGQKFVPAMERFCTKTGMSHEETVSATCLHFMSL